MSSPSCFYDIIIEGKVPTKSFKMSPSVRLNRGNRVQTTYLPPVHLNIKYLLFWALFPPESRNPAPKKLIKKSIKVSPWILYDY